MAKVNKSGKPNINITIDETILQKVEAFAKFNGINRSGAISVLLAQALQANEAIENFNKATAEALNEKITKK